MQPSEALTFAHVVTRKLVTTLRRVGLRETARLVRRHYRDLGEYTPAGRRARLAPDDFDRAYGVRTSPRLDPAEIEVSGAVALHARRHQPSPPDRFRAIVGALPIRFQDYVFVDLGSGLGRALLLAAEFPFRRVIGVELARPLHQTAAENVRRVRAHRRHAVPIETVHGDATTFRLPDESLVLYLFNPFREVALARALAGLEHSLASHPRDVWLVYYWPEHHALIDACAALAPVTAGEDFRVYRSVAVAVLRAAA